jgi:hypothetical protein
LVTKSALGGNWRSSWRRESILVDSDIIILVGIGPQFLGWRVIGDTEPV